jgi:hypothetical protein
VAALQTKRRRVKSLDRVIRTKVLALPISGKLHDGGSPRGHVQPVRRFLTPKFVTRDGQKFLFNSNTTETASAPITVILNWRGVLK